MTTRLRSSVGKFGRPPRVRFKIRTQLGSEARYFKDLNWLILSNVFTKSTVLIFIYFQGILPKKNRDQKFETANSTNFMKKSFVKIFILQAKPYLVYKMRSFGLIFFCYPNEGRSEFPEIELMSIVNSKLKCQSNSFGTYYIYLFFFEIPCVLISNWTRGGLPNFPRPLRSQAFAKLLRLDMGYFDEPINSTGALTARLATDAGKVQGATGRRISQIFINIGALGCGLGIAFYYEWRLSLLTFAFLPFMIVTQALMMKLMTGNFGGKEQQAIENASKVATEATTNIRTVASLGRKAYFGKVYKDNIDVTFEGKVQKINIYGILYGASLGVMFFMFAGLFRFSMYLIDAGIIDINRTSDIFRVLTALVFAAETAGQSAGMAPDYGQAVLAARRVVKLLQFPTIINPASREGQRPEITGKVEFSAVEFAYPTRKDVLVLKGLKTVVEPGQTLALVGQSGCGKSTCISLLERFYNASAGEVKIDGYDVTGMNLKWLRSNVGLVQQEPVLFAIWVLINFHQPCQDIEAALKEANAYDFVLDLPQGLETRCGKKGSQLSGGQKQRIAIARALIRKQKILLLDEATSALDTESEKVIHIDQP
ncbi:unnamed protein product [Oikopleura dioica]|uniref:ABC transmembrane type-1 domain-containing protein n=1 Tax=Oikopleura dioica TaxID=34765 RepID=E4YGG5_OIKDI|nr:unnamed protein product [Oikopleura dioica]